MRAFSKAKAGGNRGKVTGDKLWYCSGEREEASATVCRGRVTLLTGEETESPSPASAFTPQTPHTLSVGIRRQEASSVPDVLTRLHVPADLTLRLSRTIGKPPAFLVILPAVNLQLSL